MNPKYLLILFSVLSTFFTTSAQIVINEGSNRNFTQVVDEDNETEDWFELYNSADSAVNISGWSLSDNKDIIDKWILPNINMAANSTLLIFASGKDRKIYDIGTIWESAVLPTDDFQYLVPTSAVADWNIVSYNAESWATGKAGFGYGDDDDETLIPEGTLVVYIRKSFTITDPTALVDAVCHIDYDDGFVAYLNGVEICRSNVDGTPTWNSKASGNHDAIMLDGENPDAYELDMDLVRSAWNQGENVFAVEVHNVSNTSSDLSLKPYLSFKVNDGNTYFNSAPSWLTVSGNSYLHTNFKISSGGESVYLWDDKKMPMSFLKVKDLMLDHSVGRATDGAGELANFIEATPGSSNNDVTAYIDGYLEKPTFDLKAGFYDGNQSLSMSVVSENIEMRYTTDGSTPTESSTLYTGTAITIEHTQTINARSFSASNQLPSFTKTATYFIDEDFSIPVLSVTTDSENLFGSTGIFTNYNAEWNKPCYIEYFDEDKELAIKQSAGIQVDGGAGGSRSKPQTSFRIEPGNGTFGDGDVKYNFHPERTNRNNYASLYLRNGSNRYLDYICKDATQVRAMGKNTHNFYSEYRPIVVFINGEYYGMYEGREKINEDYLQSNYDMDTDSLNMVGISHRNKPRTILPLVGTVDAFNEDYERFLDMDPSSTNYLEEVGEMLDLDNYTDYICGQTWMTNKDWPHNNMKSWRCKGSDMRWQFAILDLEWAFLPTNTGANLATRPSYDQLAFMLDESTNGTKYAASGFWFMLMQNEDYKHRFINRLSDLMNTSYAPSAIKKVAYDVYKEAWPEIPAYYSRWNGGDTYEFYDSYYNFDIELGDREPYLRQHLREHYDLTQDVEIYLYVEPAEAGRIKINTILPKGFPWSGTYFSDVPITVEAIPNPGYTFKGWGTNSHLTSTTTSKFTTEINGSSTLFKAIFEESTTTFDGITISEISYKDGDSINNTDWFEIWNATAEELSLEGWSFTDSDTAQFFDFAANRTIAAGERLVVAKNIAAFRTIYGDLPNVTGNFTFGLAKINDEINLYNAEDELISHVSYSDLFPWALSGDVSGKTLELLNPEASLNNAENWFAGCYLGSPGAAYDSNCGATNLTEEAVSVGLELLAYPSPMQDILSLEFYIKQSQGDNSVSIYNVMGALVYMDNCEGLTSGQNKLDIDVSGLTSGQIYLISVVSNGVQETIKLIKE